MLKLSTSTEFTQKNRLGRMVQFDPSLVYEMDRLGYGIKAFGKLSGEAGKKQKLTFSGLKIIAGCAFVTLNPKLGSSQVYLFNGADDQEIALTLDVPAGTTAEEAYVKVYISAFG